MSTLRQATEDYLVLRRSLGHKLAGYDSLLSDFAAYLESIGQNYVTVAAAVEWASRPTGISAEWKSMRLMAVRKFAEYVRAIDPRTEVPSVDLLPCPKSRPTPRLYTEDEIRALMTAARGLKGSLRPHTIATLFGLLAVTGMRIGEAISLDRSDLDERESLILIRNTKFGKSREVPIHPTTLDALQAYAAKRDKVIPRSQSPAFFLSQTGTRFHWWNVYFYFDRLRQLAGIPNRRGCRPKIHGLRHTFAVRTLIECYKAGADVQARLPILSTYLGHVSPSSTYWYLTGIPELVSLAARRLEKNLGDLP